MAIKIITSVLAFVKKHGLPFLIGLVFAVVCYVALNAVMEPFSESNFCGSTCHEIETAYESWKLSSHGANKYGYRVECVDCHLPPKDKFFTHMANKSYHGTKELCTHFFGEDYDREKVRQRVLENMPNKRCQRCHDDLLAKPGSIAAKMAHKAILAKSDTPEEIKCVVCHEDAGHHR